jgi:hypothetical protein
MVKRVSCKVVSSVLFDGTNERLRCANELDSRHYEVSDTTTEEIGSGYSNLFRTFRVVCGTSSDFTKGRDLDCYV